LHEGEQEFVSEEGHRDAGREIGYCAREIQDRWAHDPPEAREVRRAANKAYQLPRRRGLLNGEEEWRTRVRRRGGRESPETGKLISFNLVEGSASSGRALRLAKTLRLILISAHFNIQRDVYPEKRTLRILSLIQGLSASSSSLRMQQYRESHLPHNCYVKYMYERHVDICVYTHIFIIHFTIFIIYL